MSEEMKNLNNEPEQAPVEEKVEAKKPLDKKTIGIIIGAAVAVVALVLALVLGGGQPANNGGDNNDTSETYTLGLGVAFGEFKIGEFNATVATVVLDSDGKIVACRLDAVQNKFAADFDNDSFSYSRLEKTKVELGSEYGMAGSAWSSDNDSDGRILEWNEQAKAFEAWCVGKTVAQVEALGAEENLQFANDHYFTKDEDLLAAGCTIQIDGFVGAVVKACKDEAKVSFKSEGNFTLGLAATSKDNGSAVANDEATIKMNVEFAAAVVEGGKIVAALNDAAQPQIAYDYDGNVTDASVGKGAEVGLKTKRELKETYGMSTSPYAPDNNGDSKVLEWYVQSAEFSKYVVGKTGAQVEALETKVVNDHNISTDDALLNAGCTIDISGLKAIVAKSVANAR